MLEGGKKTDEGLAQFNPAIFDELAKSLAVPGSEDDDGLTDTDLAFRALFSLYQFASNNPGPWSMLIRYLAEESRMWADRCAAINPMETAEKRHGIMCFNAGAANGLAAAATSLRPDRLANKLRALKAGGTQIRVVGDDW